MAALPKLYAILDAGCFSKSEELYSFTRELISAGVTLLQYRNKNGNGRHMLEQAREIKHIVGDSATLIMNDRPDLCLVAGFDGCHVGQDDLSPQATRTILGEKYLVGVSTHNPEQVEEAHLTSSDYIAVGPVFQTGSKANPDPIVGLKGVRLARELTTKPLVAIGGITRVNCREVIEAGADCVAVIADLLREPGKAAAEFLDLLA